jgi:hypothetical protein
MASCEMRIDTSSGKSMRSLLAAANAATFAAWQERRVYGDSAYASQEKLIE